jgi:hypothetical protein
VKKIAVPSNLTFIFVLTYWVPGAIKSGNGTCPLQASRIPTFQTASGLVKVRNTSHRLGCVSVSLVATNILSRRKGAEYFPDGPFTISCAVISPHNWKLATITNIG